MIFNRKEELDPKLKTELQEYIYDIVGIIHDVYKELPNGLPEYIYQEALETRRITPSRRSRFNLFSTPATFDCRRLFCFR